MTSDFDRRSHWKALEKLEKVDEGPVLDRAEGKGKLDLIASGNGRSLVIDIQVIGGNTDLEDEHNRKISYYTGLAEKVKERYGSVTMKFTSVTLTTEVFGVRAHRRN